MQCAREGRRAQRARVYLTRLRPLRALLPSQPSAARGRSCAGHIPTEASHHSCGCPTVLAKPRADRLREQGPSVLRAVHPLPLRRADVEGEASP
eukprot:15192003-Alexandrium_andersonii.AAC.1